MPSRLRFLIGLVVGAKQIPQLGSRGLCPGFPARMISAGPNLEVRAEIGALLIGDLLCILLAAFACEVWTTGNTQATSMQIGATLRTHGQTAERQRLIGQRGTTLPANKSVRHYVSQHTDCGEGVDAATRPETWECDQERTLTQRKRIRRNRYPEIHTSTPATQTGLALEKQRRKARCYRAAKKSAMSSATSVTPCNPTRANIIW